MKIINREFLPTKTRSVHAATIAFFRDHFVYAWFGGSREGAPDVAIYLYNLNNDGKTIVIGDRDEIPRWNPILFPLGDKLFLFEKSGLFCDRWTTFIHNVTKWDVDITNKEINKTAQILPAGLNGPVKTKPVILSINDENKILCGSSVETMYDWTGYIESYVIDSANCFIFQERSKPLVAKEKHNYTDLNGVTKRTLGIIQPSLWIEPQEKVRAFFRASRDYGKIYFSERNAAYKFEDWSAPIPTNLENPNSGIDTVFYKDKLYLVYNPSKTKRMPLVVSQIKQSDSDKANFEIIGELIIREKVEEEGFFVSPELSYPYVIENNGLLHLVYTYARAKIEHVVIQT